MNLKEAYDLLNFWINKKLGYYYSPPELDMIVDRGSMGLFNDYRKQYATSQSVKDSLAPFRAMYNFTPGSTPIGVITIPTSPEFVQLLACSVRFGISGMERYAAVQMINEDEIAIRLNSQVDPVTITSPVGEVIGVGVIQLWPKEPNTGLVTYLRRPAKPFFDYTTISGRVIVYNSVGSTQLEWREQDQDQVLLKALSSAGINLTDQEIAQFAEMKSGQNFQGVNQS